MRYWIGAALAFFLALVQASSVEQFHILGVSPNLVLVLLVSWLVVRGLDDVLPMIGVAGVTMAFIGLQTPGLALLALLVPFALIGFARELHVVHSETLLVLAFVAAASLIYESIMLGGVMASGGVIDLQSGFGDAVLPAILVNLALAPPVYLLMRLARPDARRHAYSF